MSVWIIIAIIYGVVTIVATILCISIYIAEKRKKSKSSNWIFLFLGPLFIPAIVFYGFIELTEYLSKVWEDGGFIKHYKLVHYRKIKNEVRKRRNEIEKVEYDRITGAYKKGELSRIDLPRTEDGVTRFEFSPKMGLKVDRGQEVKEIIYVEREYNERLNRFFQEHPDLRLYHMYKFVYLPNYCKELENGKLFHYFFPNAKPDEVENISLASSYPLQFLEYPEDTEKITHGMAFFSGDCYNHGAWYIQGDFYPLLEGSDEEIIRQLDTIVKAVHDRHGSGGLYSKATRPSVSDVPKEERADEFFYWETINPKVASLIEEVRDKLEELKEYGLAEKVLLNLLKKKQELSRLVITKDMRIILPDYNNMEIKMEPINKAVYLLFLRHPEGIIFKHLPDHRKELVEIYQKIKPLGLNERVIRSIEDVTNPMLNSINEKCARIRGAFIAQFDDSLAQHYYIYGMRGEAKKISLPRDLVVWE